MLRKEPLVTIGSLCYNTGKYVIETLKSVKGQTYTNIEHIIIDDCSADDSVSLVRKWIEENNYKCTFIQHDENKGVHASLNEILEKGNGKYISFVSDDILTENKIADLVEVLEKVGDEYGVAYGDMSYIDDKGDDIGNSTWFDDKFYKGYLPPQGDVFHNIVYSITFFVQSSLYNLQLLRQLNYKFDSRFICEDWHMNLFVTRHCKAVGSRAVYCKYRYRDNSVTATNWTDERMHKVLLSQIAMFDEVYKYPNNTIEDKLVIYKKMHTLALQLYASKKISRFEKFIISFDLFKKQPSFKNIMKSVVLLILGKLSHNKDILKFIRII